MSRTIGSIGSLPLLLHTTGYPPIGTTSRLLVDPGRSVQIPTVHQPQDWQEARVDHLADPDRHCRRSDRIRPILLRCTWSAVAHRVDFTIRPRSAAGRTGHDRPDW